MISEDVLDTYNCVIPYEDMRVSINRFVYTVTDGDFSPSTCITIMNFIMSCPVRRWFPLRIRNFR